MTLLMLIKLMLIVIVVISGLITGLLILCVIMSYIEYMRTEYGWRKK